MLKWKRPLAKLDVFRVVYVSADGHKAEEEIPASSESHTLRGLTPGMLYTISITAERGSKTSLPATIFVATGRHRKNVVRKQTPLSLRREGKKCHQTTLCSTHSFIAPPILITLNLPKWGHGKHSKKKKRKLTKDKN